jgi:NAD(P)-dependent dehydrogenase (short-subunit alcohol dehydrogenase family)
MDLGLKDRRVLVTGGSQGIGYAIARGFLAEGCRAAIVATGAAAQALGELGEHGPVTGKAVDLAQRGAPEGLADEFKDTDILVNNAGAIPTGDIFSIDEARWREAWDLKVFGYINLMRAMYRHMRGRGPKVIVNVLGLGGEKPHGITCAATPQHRADGRHQVAGREGIDDGIA